MGDIGNRLAGAEGIHVGCREDGPVFFEQRQSFCLAKSIDQLFPETLGPGFGGFLNFPVQVTMAHARDLAGFGSDNKMPARQYILAQKRVINRNFPPVGVTEDFFDFLTQSGMIAISRHINDSRNVPFIPVFTDKGAGPRPLKQMQNPKGGFQKLALTGQEQFIPWIGFKDVGDCLAGVAGGAVGGAFLYVGDLFSQDWDVPGAFQVGF